MPTLTERERRRRAAIAPELDDLTPMLLSERVVKSFPGNDYLAEIKYDGYRTLAGVDVGGARLKSRNGADASAWFPEVTESLAELGRGRNVVDGEMCVLDEIGRPDFDALHSRASRRRWAAGDPPVVYCVFDVLLLDGQPVMHFPLVERKALLKSLLTPAPARVLYVDHFVGNVGWLYTRAAALELEGVVAKKADSIYLPGRRTDAWLKLKRPGAVPPGRFRRKPRDPAAT